MAKAQTLEDVLVKAKAVHGEKYTIEGFGVNNQRNQRTLNVMCPKHGVFNKTLITYLKGEGCTPCSYAYRAENKRTTLEEAAAKGKELYSENYKYTALSFDKRGKAVIHYTCDKHGDQVQSLHDHYSGHKCKACGYDDLRTDAEEKYNYYLPIAKAIHNDTYEYLGYIPKSEVNGSLFRLKCKQHGEFTQRFTNHSNGEGCPKCGSDSGGLAKRRDLEEYVAKAMDMYAGKFSYGNLVYSKDHKSKIEVYCSEHGLFLSDAVSHILKKTGCPTCAPRVSKAQQEIYGLLAQAVPDLMLEQALDSSQKRWDIVSRSRKIAIEYDGLHWHSSKYKSANSQFGKWSQALKAGYRQLNVFEDEWLNKPNIVKRLLLNALGVSSETKIAARKTAVHIILGKEAREFTEANHIQGYRASSSYVGLSHNGSLVAVLGYELRASGRGRCIDPTQVEITRYCTSVSVQGGFGKLLKHLQKHNPMVTDCYTFSDNRLYSGNLYKLLGFKKVADIPYDYYYTKFSERFNKANFQKSRFQRKDMLYDPALTEKQLAELNGYYQIYDCGKQKWNLKVK